MNGGKLISVIQIFLYIIGKLISAPCEFSEYTVDPLLSLIPVILCNVVTHHRADAEFDIGKSQLVKHQAAARVERFTNDQRCSDLNTSLVNDFS